MDYFKRNFPENLSDLLAPEHACAQQKGRPQEAALAAAATVDPGDVQPI